MSTSLFVRPVTGILCLFTIEATNGFSELIESITTKETFLPFLIVAINHKQPNYWTFTPHRQQPTDSPDNDKIKSVLGSDNCLDIDCPRRDAVLPCEIEYIIK